MKEVWIQPANIKHFDLIEHFKNDETIYFKGIRPFNEGDIVFIYLASPYKQIKYRCHVIKVNISVDEIQRTAEYAYDGKSKKFVCLLLDEVFEDDLLPFEELKSNDLLQFQLPSRASYRLKRYLTMKTTIDLLKD